MSGAAGAGAPSPGGLAAALKRLSVGEPLTADEAAAAVGEIMEGGASEAQIGAFLMGLRVKGETPTEVAGVARAVRSRAQPVPHRYPRLVDTCGTGGDGAQTFNISTTTAFVVAGAGEKVAKHGNRAISSRTGSADVLEALGIQVDMAGPEAAAALDDVGITFLFAPAFHAALRHAGPTRRALGVRTVFNVIGPLCNPAGATSQIVGVFEPRLVRLVAEVLGELGAARALVVHGSDGLDELTISGPSHVAEWDGRDVREYDVAPEDVGLERADVAALRGGDAAENATILRRVLEGEPGPALDVVLLNAGAALLAAGAAADLADGVARARASVEGGAAVAALDGLVAYSRRLQDAALRPTDGTDRVDAVQPGWGRA